MIKFSLYFDVSSGKILLGLACGITAAVCANYIYFANKNIRASQKNEECKTKNTSAGDCRKVKINSNVSQPMQKVELYESDKTISTEGCVEFGQINKPCEINAKKKEQNCHVKSAEMFIQSAFAEDHKASSSNVKSLQSAVKKTLMEKSIELAVEKTHEEKSLESPVEKTLKKKNPEPAVEKTHEEKSLKPAVEKMHEENSLEAAVEMALKIKTLEQNGELSTAQQEKNVSAEVFADTQQTKKLDGNNEVSSEEKNAILKIISHNETYFKNIIKNFESNYKLFQNGVSHTRNLKMKKVNLLYMAKVRKERIDEGDDFSKIFIYL